MNEAKCLDCGEDMSNRRNGVDYAHTCVGHKHTSYLCLPHEQTLEGMIEARDAEIARLNALLAEARIEVGLLAAMVPARAFSKKSDAEYIEAKGERARAILAKLGA